MTKLLIDTDIGGDIDDAFALCLALGSPELEILGVTTVFQCPVQRAQIAKALLAAAGRGDIPVVAGEAKPLGQTELYGRPIDFETKPLSYGAEFEKTEIDGRDGVDFLIRTLESQGEPVTVVTIGALTNLAAVLTKRPDLKNRIEKFCVMGGAYDRNYAEYNFACDPEAARIVLRSGISCDLVGTDVTFRCMMGERQLARLAASSSSAIRLLLSLNKSWGHNVYLHDPLALYNAIDSQYLTFQNREIEVETKGKLTRGVAVTLSDWNWQLPANDKLRVAVDVRAEEFVEECTRRILRLGESDAAECAV